MYLVILITLTRGFEKEIPVQSSKCVNVCIECMFETLTRHEHQ